MAYRLGSDPFDPRDNILKGTACLREMPDRFGWSGFVVACNAGPKRYRQYLLDGRPPPGEARNDIAELLPLIGLAAVDESLRRLNRRWIGVHHRSL